MSKICLAEPKLFGEHVLRNFRSDSPESVIMLPGTTNRPLYRIWAVKHLLWSAALSEKERPALVDNSTIASGRGQGTIVTALIPHLAQGQ